MDSNGNSAAETGAYNNLTYQWQYRGPYVVLAPALVQDATVFIPIEYNLPSRSRQVSDDLTVNTRNSGLSYTEFMKFACRFGPVVEAVWMPEGKPGGDGWIRLYSGEDARTCFEELHDKGYEAGITNEPFLLPPYQPPSLGLTAS